MTEPDPLGPETSAVSPDKPADVRKPRGIRFLGFRMGGG